MSLYQSQGCFPIAYYGIAFDSFSMPFHRHKRCEIMYVTRGTCSVSIEDTTYSLCENDFVFIDENVSHLLRIDSGCKVLNLEFECSDRQEPVSLCRLREKDESFARFFNRALPCLFGHDSAALGAAMKDCIVELTFQKGSYLCMVLLERILLELARCAQTDISCKGIGYLNKVQKFIDHEFREDLTVAMIASVADINESYLQMLFQKYYQCSIMTYVNRLRLNDAVFLLKNTQKPIVDIAAEVGYHSRQHFTHSFKNAFLMSPQKYRGLFAHDVPEQSANTQTFQKV